MASSHIIVSDPFTAIFISFKARQLCRRAGYSRSDFDEVRQSMRLYLLEKAHLFDPTRGNIEQFVTNAITTWVAMALRYRKFEKRCESFQTRSLEGTLIDGPSGTSELGAMLLEADADRRMQLARMSSVESVDLRDSVAFAMGKLSAADRELVTSVAEFGMTQTAARLGISGRQVKNAMDRIRRVFKKVMLDAK